MFVELKSYGGNDPQIDCHCVFAEAFKRTSLCDDLAGLLIDCGQSDPDDRLYQCIVNYFKASPLADSADARFQKAFFDAIEQQATKLKTFEPLNIEVDHQAPRVTC